MSTRLKSLLVKELIQFSRDPIIVVMILYFYTLCVIICTYALTFDIKELPFTVVDYDHTPASRSLIEHFSASDAFKLVGSASDEDTAVRWLETGEVRMALIIPSRFDASMRRGESQALQMIIDGGNSNTADFARGYAAQIVAMFQTEVAGPNNSSAAAIKPVVRFWYNPNQSFTAFMVLSMIAANTLMVAMIHPAASFVREKERGTIEQLIVTPVTSLELFVAKTIPTFVMGLLAVFPSLLIVWMFGVPMRGSLSLFLVLTGVFLLSAIAMGVFVAVLSNTLQQALLLAFFALFPLMFLSGSMSPIESMPKFLQQLSLASPLRHYMDVILGIFLKGAGPADLWLQTVLLLGIGSSLYMTALVVFQRRAS